MREIPYSMIQMPLYEIMKKQTILRTNKPAADFSILDNTLNGGVSGGVAGLITTPIDVIKTRLMIDRERSLSIRESAKEIYRDEGIRGFARGAIVRTTALAIITSVLFVSYEKIKGETKRYLYGNEDQVNSL